MARDFNGTSDLIELIGTGTFGPADNGTTSIAFCCWVKLDTNTDWRSIWNKGNDRGGGGADHFILGRNLNTNNFYVQVFTDLNTIIVQLGAADTNLHFIAGSWDTSLGLFGFMDGTEYGPTVGEATLRNPNVNFKIGCGTTSGGGNTEFTDGQISECAYWQGITHRASHWTQIYRGFSPFLVSPGFLEIYLPLIGRGSPEPELIAGKNGTLTGTAAIPHPRRYSPALSYIIRSGVGANVSRTPLVGAGALAGTAGNMGFGLPTRSAIRGT